MQNKLAFRLVLVIKSTSLIKERCCMASSSTVSVRRLLGIMEEFAHRGMSYPDKIPGRVED